jgi:hypothetical protein
MNFIEKVNQVMSHISYEKKGSKKDSLDYYIVYSGIYIGTVGQGFKYKGKPQWFAFSLDRNLGVCLATRKASVRGLVNELIDKKIISA